MKLNKNTSTLIIIALIVFVTILFTVNIIEDNQNETINQITQNQNIQNNYYPEVHQTFYCNHGMCTHEYKSDNVVCYIVVRSNDNAILNNSCFEKNLLRK
jgi:uncharacterized membrane protein